MLLNPVTSQYVKLIVFCVMWLQPLSLLVADEREAVQKKTFTKWVNSHLGRVTCRIGDLYTDLRDGRMLIRLLEVLSGEQLVSITWKQPLPSLTLTQTPIAWPPPCCTSQEEGEIMCFIFSFFYQYDVLLLLPLLVFLFLNSCHWFHLMCFVITWVLTIFPLLPAAKAHQRPHAYPLPGECW